MRRAMTPPEQRLWMELRANRLADTKFRRQKVIGQYIADFAANAPKIVIELDGDSHASQADYDAARDAFLTSEGYRIVRFANRDVLTNLDGVLTVIAGVIDELRGCSPPPTPSPEGEGALGSDKPSPLQGRGGSREAAEGEGPIR